MREYSQYITTNEKPGVKPLAFSFALTLQLLRG
ncbi:hypothetical protein QE357_002038 [Siphonobacter sp. BAB-5404]|nr:hypothetical protein [Siphonobacter sp. SORGH_AS_0500]